MFIGTQNHWNYEVFKVDVFPQCGAEFSVAFSDVAVATAHKASLENYGKMEVGSRLETVRAGAGEKPRLSIYF